MFTKGSKVSSILSECQKLSLCTIKRSNINLMNFNTLFAKHVIKCTSKEKQLSNLTKRLYSLVNVFLPIEMAHAIIIT